MAATERMQAFVRVRQPPPPPPLRGGRRAAIDAPQRRKEARATIETTETGCTISITSPAALDSGLKKNTIKDYCFPLDGVFGPDTTQRELYEAVMWPQVQALLEGRDTLTFAYGVTNAGKTYTVQGGATSEQRGVLPRALSSIFGALDALRAGGEAAAGTKLDPNCSYAVSASFLEIHCNEAYDLFGSQPLRIKIEGGKVAVDGLEEAVLEDLAEAQKAVEAGWAKRQCASNGVHDASSRSHAVLCIKLIATPTGLAEPKETRLVVVDLGGAEKQQSSGQRLKEANAINQDLTCLGRCLSALRWNQSHPNGKKRVLPYRESLIATLFHDFLSGSGQTVVIAALNPAARAASTLDTLRFASEAQLIKTRPAPAKEAAKKPAVSQSASKRTSEEMDENFNHSNQEQLASTEMLSPIDATKTDSFELHEQILALQERLQERLQQLEAGRLGDERRIREEVPAEMQQAVHAEVQRLTLEVQRLTRQVAAAAAQSPITPAAAAAAVEAGAEAAAPEQAQAAVAAEAALATRIQSAARMLGARRRLQAVRLAAVRVQALEGLQEATKQAEEDAMTLQAAKLASEKSEQDRADQLAACRALGIAGLAVPQDAPHTPNTAALYEALSLQITNKRNQRIYQCTQCKKTFIGWSSQKQCPEVNCRAQIIRLFGVDDEQGASS